MSTLRSNRRLLRALQMFSAFLLGVVLSQIFGQTFCGFKSVEKVDEQSYLLVILVLTAPKNVERREAMRETWLSLRPRTFDGSDYQKDIIFVPRVLPSSFLEVEGVEQQKLHLRNYQNWIETKTVPNVKVPGIKMKPLFAIGTFGLSDDEVEELKSEQKVYHDLLLIDDLQDSYRNLTLKLIKSMAKLVRTTPNFKFVLKTDDDSYVKLDLLAQDLIQYSAKVARMQEKKLTLDNLELYWGFFNGRASIKKSGQWQEINFNLCDRYLPYALGGGYVLSKNLVKYIAEHGENFSRFISEDISVGTWLSPFKNIHRRHDLRFDTAYMPRKCKNFHFVLHKRTVKDMREIHAGDACFSEVAYDVTKKPAEYFYDWTITPTKCCDNRN